MKHRGSAEVEEALAGIPVGTLAVERHVGGEIWSAPLEKAFQMKEAGRGRVDIYPVFPGVEAAFLTFLASEISFQHDASESVLEIFYCRTGRTGWNMSGGTAVYLGAGDMTVHSAVCCSDSAMMFPLGYSEGISISVDLDCFAVNCPEILREAGADLQKLRMMLCREIPLATPSSPELAGVFDPLYAARPDLRLPWLKLKVQELFLRLESAPPNRKELTQYFSQQTERIKEIHDLLTEHLNQRFTIEELSRRYLINSSTLKEVFKTVYGLPIATYMKERRIRQAVKLLLETDDTIAAIAKQVGYETQGKFTKAFKDITQMLPSEYRKKHSPQ